MDLLEEVYRLTHLLPPDEKYVLSAQMRRAALSVPNNIAEGSGRGTTLDFRNFLSYSRGSTKETQSMILSCERLRFIDPSETIDALELTEEVAKMLWSFRASLERKGRRR